MKKTIRAIIAALLAAVTALGCTTAFAAETDKVLLWDYYDWEYSYDYAGELIPGKNTVSLPDGSYNCYFVFDAEESGFYTVGFTDYAFNGWIGSPESVVDGVAINEADCIYHRTESNFRCVTFRFEKGKNIIGIDYENEIKNKTIEISYEGSEIQSVSIENSLLMNRDIYGYGEYCEIYADTVITFSSGAEITLGYVEGCITKDIEKGSNTVNLSLLGENCQLTVDVYLVSDVIESVEISNIEDYLNAKIYYNGYEGYYPVNETFTFTFIDGSTRSLIYNYGEDNCITLPDGTKAAVYLTTENTDGNVFLYVMVEGSAVRAYDCNETEADANENFSNLVGNGKYYAERVSHYLRYSAIALLECDGIGEIIDYGAENSIYYIRRSVESFLNIFREIFSFIAFLL